jgi:uncharacterized Zn-finger protein
MHSHTWFFVSKVYTLAVCLQKTVCKKRGCGRVFKTRQHLTAHMRWHEGLWNYICDVPNCWLAFVDNQTLQRHMNTHTGGKPFECGICKKCFSQLRSLKNHMKIHTQNVSFIDQSEVRI